MGSKKQELSVDLTAPNRDAVLFGQRVRELRVARGITLTALAERLGTSKSFLSNIENGKQAPGLTTILRIARVLGCGVNEVMRAFDRKTLEELFPEEL
jgi:transcriptional regulator with XRE-family HTH domain